ncbi:DUF6702 family protein [Ulvibacter antarcticus]|uniref:Peptidase E n=1 Tax=Ulvibacter antarcticus TaxID=442714 RepID=A0A3L9YF86_9FLAO|nr:DUF6702 family protein [Ulvibacter antarcticus]RMA57779.1 hypothetical protein BXY75_2584 [Ulvibacter antarcticus]
MKILKVVTLLLLFPILVGASDHKFYVSITKVEYVEEKQSLQIISQIFIDDIEDVLQQRYNPDISLDTKRETESDALYLKEYVLQKLKIWVNGKPVELNYIGKEYEIDMVKVYIEVTGVSSLKTFEVENKLLMDLFEEQQNIIHFKEKGKRKSLILERDNPKGLLNLN